MTRADQRKFHYIYKITRTDGKFYVGMHSTDNLEDGYFGSGQLLWKSIKKHGKEKHSKEILEFLPSRKELKDREREMVNEELLGNKQCMNLKLGGEGGWEHITPAQKVAGGEAAGRITGKVNIAQARSQISAEARRQSLKTRELGGDPFTMRGKQHSESTKQKMSTAGSGANNSQFGTCWVRNETHCLKIRREELPKYQSSGYQPGRKVLTRDL